MRSLDQQSMDSRLLFRRKSTQSVLLCEVSIHLHVLELAGERSKCTKADSSHFREAFIQKCMFPPDPEQCDDDEFHSAAFRVATAAAFQCVSTASGGCTAWAARSIAAIWGGRSAAGSSSTIAAAVIRP